MESIDANNKTPDTASAQPPTLEYRKASWWKRLFAFLFDFVCAVILATCLAAGGNPIVNANESYSSAQKTMGGIELSSSLYVKVGGLIKPITTAWAFDASASPTEDDFRLVDANFELALSSFFNDSSFFPDSVGKDQYLSLKVGDSSIKQSDKSTPYWHYEIDSHGQSQLIASTNYQTLMSFYTEAVDAHAIPLISSQRGDYINASRLVFWVNFLFIYLISVFSLFVFYCLIPLFFRRGWQTFGKKLFKISLINGHAVNPTRTQYWIRSCLLLLVEFVLGSASFGIPLIISFTMMMTRSDAQSFHDYVAGVYVIDSTDDTVFLSREEYDSRNASLESMAIKDASTLIKK